MNELNQFIKFCKNLQSQSREDIQRFFEGVLFFPYDNELLLQAFLFLNIEKYFPFCTELLLFEKSPNGENTDQGKCDFVYLMQGNKIALIETKFIDTKSTGKTERSRRNNHKQKVFQQVNTLRQKFSDTWNIPFELIDCCIFTTEDLTCRAEAKTVISKYISIEELERWRQETKSFLQPEVSVSTQGRLTEADDGDLNEIDKVWMKYYICDVCSHPEICTASKICYFDLSDSD